MTETITLPDKSDFKPKLFTPNVMFRWLHDGRAFEACITSSSRDDIDAYVNANITALRLWDAAQPFYSLQDVSHHSVIITPYFRSRLDGVTKVMKETGLHGSSVIVMSNTVTGRMVQVYGRVFARKAEPISQIWVINYDKGVEKLKELVEA